MNYAYLKPIFVFLLLLQVVSAASYLVIIDASTSMDDYLPEGGTKIDAAKAAAIDFIDSSVSDEFAIMKFNMCNDGGDPTTGTIRVIKDFTTDKTSLRSSVNSIQTGDYTPIAEAIAEGRKYIQDEKSGRGTIILLTDGEENCGGDPVLEAQETYEQGIAVIDVVSYNIDPYDTVTVQQHKDIAAAGGGKYYTADNADDLKGALTAIKREQSGGACCLPTFLFGFVGLVAVLRMRK